jgi:hypothetical protein
LLFRLNRESNGKAYHYFVLLGVESKFGVGMGRVEWLDDEKLWSLIGVNGQNLGQFKGLVASDKNIVSTRIAEATGRVPPLGMNMLSFYPQISFYFLHLRSLIYL